MPLRILYQDNFMVAIDKPAGFHVHPPEDRSFRISDNHNCLALLRNQIGKWVYPAHRIDRSTSGVVLFALSSEFANSLNRIFSEHLIKKTYFAVARGWTPDHNLIDRALKSDSENAKLLPAKTGFSTLARIELPFAVGPYKTARYSLLEVTPTTGRHHQIRRHLAGAAHPLINDSVHGDGEHNRFFRETLKIQPLLLKAQALVFTHPHTDKLMTIRSRWSGPWHKIFDLFGLCPFG